MNIKVVLNVKLISFVWMMIKAKRSFIKYKLLNLIRIRMKYHKVIK